MARDQLLLPPAEGRPDKRGHAAADCHDRAVELAWVARIDLAHRSFQDGKLTRNTREWSDVADDDGVEIEVDHAVVTAPGRLEQQKLLPPAAQTALRGVDEGRALALLCLIGEADQLERHLEMPADHVAELGHILERIERPGPDAGDDDVHWNQLNSLSATAGHVCSRARSAEAWMSIEDSTFDQGATKPEYSTCLKVSSLSL
jgi:hypothetical protein